MATKKKTSTSGANAHTRSFEQRQERKRVGLEDFRRRESNLLYERTGFMGERHPRAEEAGIDSGRTADTRRRGGDLIADELARRKATAKKKPNTSGTNRSR